MRSYIKFSPGSVPKPNHTKTLSMCLVDSYPPPHIGLNLSTLVSKMMLKDQREIVCVNNLTELE